MMARTALLLLAVVTGYSGTFELRGALSGDAVLFDDKAQLEYGRQALADNEYQLARARLKQVIEHRPLYAPGWMDLALADAGLNRPDEALLNAQRALELWPYRIPLLWRAAQFFPLAGCPECAETPLKRLLLIDPPRSTRALTLLRSLGTSDSALRQTVRQSAASTQDVEDSLRRISASLVRTGESNLALDLVTDNSERLSAAATKAILDGLVVSAYHQGDLLAYCGALAMEPGHSCVPGNDTWLTIAPRARPGWQLLEIKGAEAEAQKELLRIEFDGTENLDYSHLRLLIPLADPRPRQISGMWRGDRVTTRSGMFLELRMHCDQGTVTNRIDDPRYGSWDWSHFSVAIPDGACAFAEVIVRRSRTANLDRLLSGALEIAAVRVDRAPG